MSTREALHELIAALPESQLDAAWRLLASLQENEAKRVESSRAVTGALDDPVLRALLTAPEDDEAETPEEAIAVQEAREARARGAFLRDEDLDRELGW